MASSRGGGIDDGLVCGVNQGRVDAGGRRRRLPCAVGGRGIPRTATGVGLITPAPEQAAGVVVTVVLHQLGWVLGPACSSSVGGGPGQIERGDAFVLGGGQADVHVGAERAGDSRRGAALLPWSR